MAGLIAGSVLHDETEKQKKSLLERARIGPAERKLRGDTVPES
jgi:hypothetical protein